MEFGLTEGFLGGHGVSNGVCHQPDADGGLVRGSSGWVLLRFPYACLPQDSHMHTTLPQVRETRKHLGQILQPLVACPAFIYLICQGTILCIPQRVLKMPSFFQSNLIFEKKQLAMHLRKKNSALKSLRSSFECESPFKLFLNLILH